MTALFLISVPFVLLLILFKPKWGTFLIWPILFTYPHNFWYSHGFLPLNIGVDDLFCLFLFVVVVLRRNLMEGVPIRFGFAFWAVSLFAAVSILAHASGFFEVSGAYRTVVIKDTLKNLVFFALFYAVLHCIDDHRDLRIQFGMFSLAALIGALLVVLQHFFPHRMEIFAIPRVSEFGGLTEESRAAGAFMNPNAAACILTCSLLLVITSIRLFQGVLMKILFYGFTFFLLAAILLTQSRAGLLALFGALVLMGLFGKNKRYTWLLLGMILVVGVLFTEVRQSAGERFQEAYNPATGEVGVNVAGRFEIWKTYLETSTFKDYLLGQGPFAASVQTGMAESHSLYVSILTVYGLPGLIWAGCVLILFVRRSHWVRKSWDQFLGVVGDGCLWAFAAWAIYGVASDALSSNYTRYMLFFLIVLVDRAAFFYRQQNWMLENAPVWDSAVANCTDAEGAAQ